jgi:hypothetical protein
MIVTSTLITPQGADLSRDMQRFLETDRAIRESLVVLRNSKSTTKDDLKRLRHPYEQHQAFGEDIQKKMIAQVASLKSEISAIAKKLK